MESYTYTHQVHRSERNYIHQIYADTGCRLDNLLEEKDDRDDGKGEKEKQIDR